MENIELNHHQPVNSLEIPTEEAEAALKFCKSLSAFLQNPGNAYFNLYNENIQSQLPEISVIIPVYNEQDNIPVLYQRLKSVLNSIEKKHEIIFVNDGSNDQSLALLHDYSMQDHSILIIELARNFGHQAAISAGLDFARGKAVIVMDADLQDPPEILPQFIAKWKEGYEVVYAIRQRRKEGYLKCLAYKVFYRLLRWMANIDIPLDAGDFCIMDRHVVDILTHMPERNRFIRGIRSWVGLNQIGIDYERDVRFAGKPKFTFSRLMYLALDGLVSFSFLPLRIISLLGFVISFFSILLAIFYTIQKILHGLNPPGFASLIVSIFFFAGIQLITMGVIGEYVGRIFEEVKHRPLYIIKKIHGIMN